MDFDQIVAAARAWAAKEGIKLEEAIRRFSSAILGEDVALLNAPAGFKVLHLKEATATRPVPLPRREASILSASDRTYCETHGLDPADVEKYTREHLAERETQKRVAQAWRGGR